MKLKKMFSSLILSTVMLGSVVTGPMVNIAQASTNSHHSTKLNDIKKINETYSFDFKDMDGGGQVGKTGLNKYNLEGQNSSVSNDFNLWVNGTNRAILYKGALVNKTTLPAGAYYLALSVPMIDTAKLKDLKLVIQYTNGRSKVISNAFDVDSTGGYGTIAELDNSARIGFQYDGEVFGNSFSFTGYAIRQL